ncbi:melanoma-associated antigen 8-like [Ochotona princeps]|uniref:melanoma-associated antigen 8-like n=1 Tax=Ochotona princeps TaxID=9978 RepID=UPI0027149DF6|nr:melanoma-associated antigen 8-like [Ochotona princeps]
MMPHRQKSRLCRMEGDLQAPGGVPGRAWVRLPVSQEPESTAAASSTLALPTQREVSAAGPPIRAQSRPSTSSGTGSAATARRESRGGAEACQDAADLRAQHENALDIKMAELLQLLLLKYRLKEPITKAEMLSHVTKQYEAYFPFMFRKVSECIQVALGIHVKQVDPIRHCYVLETALGLTYNGMQDHDRSMPKTSFLIMVLGLIFSNGNRVSEEELWEALSALEVYDGREHYIYGEPRRLLTEEWVRERYIEYRQVPCSDPARYEFLWGPRTHAETTKMRVLQYLATYYSVEPESYASLYLEALREENQRARLGDAA